jgi:hypothetical protein
MFIRSQERAFPADSVVQIDIVDSTWNGALIGAAAAPVLVFGIRRWEENAVPDSNSLMGLMTLVLGACIPLSIRSARLTGRSTSPFTSGARTRGHNRPFANHRYGARSLL